MSLTNMNIMLKEIMSRLFDLEVRAIEEYELSYDQLPSIMKSAEIMPVLQKYNVPTSMAFDDKLINIIRDNKLVDKYYN